MQHAKTALKLCHHITPEKYLKIGIISFVHITLHSSFLSLKENKVYILFEKDEFQNLQGIPEKHNGKQQSI